MDEHSPQFPPEPPDPWAPPPQPGAGASVPPDPRHPPYYGSNPYQPESPHYPYPGTGAFPPYGGQAVPGGAGTGQPGDTNPLYPPGGAYSAPGQPWAGRGVPGSQERRRGLLFLAALTLAVALVGGGVGGAIGYNAASDSGSRHSSSALAIPISSSKLPAPTGSVQAVAAKVLPSVVSIDVSNLPNNRSVFPGFPGLPGGDNGGNVVEGSGSGVVLSSDGLILTNNHVAGAGDLAVTFQNGRTVRAKLVQSDKTTDLAVIKADGVTDAAPISFGRSADLAVGQEVVAIGSPLGLSGTVTSGIVSALHRPIQPQDSGAGDGTNPPVIDGIQTDAPINPGNSGGALVDMNGNLIGITSAIASLGGGLGGQSGSIGLGFAIPVDQARVIADKLAKGEAPAHALLGVEVRSSPDLAQRGALINRVSAGGPADKAGLKKGDLVTKIDNRPIDTNDGLVASVHSHQPGDKVTLTYIRGNETKDVDVILGSDAK